MILFRLVSWPAVGFNPPRQSPGFEAPSGLKLTGCTIVDWLHGPPWVKTHARYQAGARFRGAKWVLTHSLALSIGFMARRGFKPTRVTWREPGNEAKSASDGLHGIGHHGNKGDRAWF